MFRVSGRLSQFQKGLQRLQSTHTSPSPRGTSRRNQSEIIPEREQEYWRDSDKVPSTRWKDTNPLEMCALVSAGGVVLVKGVPYSVTNICNFDAILQVYWKYSIHTHSSPLSYKSLLAEFGWCKHWQGRNITIKIQTFIKQQFRYSENFNSTSAVRYYSVSNNRRWFMWVRRKVSQQNFSFVWSTANYFLQSRRLPCRKMLYNIPYEGYCFNIYIESHQIVQHRANRPVWRLWN